jgi:serine/threonine protein kinase
MGALYLVQDLEAFGRLRVLKEMLDYVDPADYPDRATYEQAVHKAHERFEDEARILASLHHPGIPEIMAYFTELGRNYIVMEYVEGKDLNEGLTHVDEQGSLVAGQSYPADDVVRWAVQVCKILEYLAQRTPTPVIHHDIKPANLVLDKNTGDVRLVDFGTAQARLAAQVDVKPGLHKSSIFGTIGYAPPEQYQGKSVPKSDVYALAATMYHLLTDDDPQNHPMSFPWPTSLERRLVRALNRAIEPDLRRRSSAAQFRKALEQWLERPQDKKASRKRGDFRVVLGYVPDQMIDQTIEALQQELAVTETEATIKAYSSPLTILSTTSHPAAEKVVSQLEAAGAQARLVEVNESYSRSLGRGGLRQQLVTRGQTRKLVATKLGRDRRCHCFECGHDWTAPMGRGRRPPLECPQCKSRRWSLRRVFKCRVCGHEFAHGDQELPAKQLFPACPACGTIDWLSRDLPLLRVKGRRLDLGTVRLGQKASVEFAIANRGKGRLRGLIRCREPWLQVERSFVGEEVITLPIETELLDGDRRHQGIIDVLSNGGAQQVKLEFLAQTPERIRISRAILDFGQVDAEPAVRTLRVTNGGGGLLRGSVATDAPWLQVSSTELSGNAVDLSLVAQPTLMPAGQSLSSSLQLSTNGGDLTIPVRAQALPPILALLPASLEFLAVPPAEKRRMAVQVANAGTGHLQGRITSRPDWLRVSRTRWSDNAWELVVEVDGRRLADGLERTGAIHFASNGGEADLNVRAVALAPTLMVEPYAVDLGSVPVGARPRCRLQVTNLGSGSLTGTAHTTVPWLHVEPSQFSGKRARLTAWLNTKDLTPGRYSGNVEIESNGGQASVAIHLQVTQRQGWRQRLGGLFSR